MFTLELADEEANLDSVRAKLGLERADVVESFGVVALDPARRLYAILLDEAAADRLEGTEGVAGPYANPKIEPFGPPK